MVRTERAFNPEAWTKKPDRQVEEPKLRVIDGGGEPDEPEQPPKELQNLELYLLTCPDRELTLLEEYLETYRKTDALFDAMGKTKGEEKQRLKTDWNNAKKQLIVDDEALPEELQRLLQAVPDFGRKHTMRGIEFMVKGIREKVTDTPRAANIDAQEGEALQKAVQGQAMADKARIRTIRRGIREGNAKHSFLAIPHVEKAHTSTAPRAGWLKRTARNIALAMLPFIGGGAVDTSVSRKGEEAAKPAGVTAIMPEEEPESDMPQPTSEPVMEFTEEEAREASAQKPNRVVTREKMRRAVARRNATRTKTFEPLDISADTAQGGGRSRDLYENLQAMDPTGAGTHIPLREEELRAAAKEARDRVLGEYGVSAVDDDSQTESAPQASR